MGLPQILAVAHVNALARAISTCAYPAQTSHGLLLAHVHRRHTTVLHFTRDCGAALGFVVQTVLVLVLFLFVFLLIRYSSLVR